MFHGITKKCLKDLDLLEQPHMEEDKSFLNKKSRKKSNKINVKMEF